MPLDRRTILLAAIRNEYCRTLTNKEWTEIFIDVEKLRFHMVDNALEDLVNGYGSDKIASMFADFITKGYISVK